MWNKKYVDLPNLKRINSGYVAPSSNVRSVSVRVGKRRETHGVAATRTHFLMKRKNMNNSTITESLSPVVSPTSSTVFFNAQGMDIFDS